MLDASKNEVPAGFVLLQRHDGKPLYAACLDGGRFHGWLMSKHPDGQWVSQRKLESWEVMQSEDQRDYGIVHETAATKPTACALPPTGWTCTRAPGHEGPCAAVATEVCADDYTPEQMVIYQHGVEDGKLVARGMERYKAGIAAREAATKPAAAPAVPEGFAEWLSREMPAGTVINDPAWWAPRIVRALAATPSPQIAEVAELPPRREPHSTDTRDQAHLAEGWNACLDAIAASRRAAGGEVAHPGVLALKGIPAGCALQVRVAADLCERNDYLTCAATLRAIADQMSPLSAQPASAGQAKKVCGAFECKAGQRDGVTCAEGECDIDSGVRTLSGSAGQAAPAAAVRAAERIDAMHKGVVSVFAAIKAEHLAAQPAEGAGQAGHVAKCATCDDKGYTSAGDPETGETWLDNICTDCTTERAAAPAEQASAQVKP